MKILALVFSARKEGNCSRLVEYCLDCFRKKGWDTDLVIAYDLSITPCSHCNYECFEKEGDCPLEDDIPLLYRKCLEADALIFAVPDYGSHLSSLYFSFMERGQSEHKIFRDFNRDFLRKVNFIVIGNLSAGGDMALHEALYGITNQGFGPATLLFPAGEYDRNSLKGDLIEVPDVKKRLELFVERIIRKNERVIKQS